MRHWSYQRLPIVEDSRLDFAERHVPEVGGVDASDACARMQADPFRVGVAYVAGFVLGLWFVSAVAAVVPGNGI
jgi:hypothetical protein